MPISDRTSRTYFKAAASALALAAAGLWGPLAAAAPAGQLEEVVVTAQKKAERLQDVPISVTAVTTRALETHRFELLSDLNGLAPNVYINSGLVGQGSIIATIRGLTSAPVFPGQSEGVSFYLDGVYLGNTYGDLIDLADVAQIEALKGPQGTLFGRSSVGGAISITTTNPTGHFHVTETLSGGNYDQFRNKTHIEFPRMGAFTANLTYLHFQRTGDINNLGAGTVWDLRTARASNPYYGTHANDVFSSSKTLGDQNVNAVSGTVRFDPVEQFTLTYKFDYSRNDYTPYANGISFIGSGCTFFTTTCLAQVLAAQPPGTVLPVANLTRPDAVNDNFDGPSYEINTGHALTFTYHINKMFTVKDIAAYRYNNVHFDANTIGDGGLTMQVAGVSPFFYLFYPPAGPNKSPAYGTPFLDPVSDNDYYNHQWSNELQFFTTTKWFSLTSGWMIYAQEGKTWDLKQITFPNAAGTWISGAGTAASPYVLPPCGNTDQYTSCTTPSPVPPNLNVGGFRTAAHSEAIYSQAQIHVTPQIDIIAGARESWDSSSLGGDGAQFGVPGPPYQSAHDTRPTYRIGGQYKPTPDIMLYMTYSTGFIPGGVFNGVQYNPETSTSYEGGFKADWLDHKLRTNLAVFDVEYVGFQQFSFAGGILHVINVDNPGTAYGAEFEGTLIPIHGLTLGVNVGYTHFQYADHNNPVSATIPYFVPEWTINLNGGYESDPLDWALRGKFMIHGDAGYTSSVHLQTGCIGTSPSCLSPAAYQAVTVGPQWLLNGRVGLTEIPVGRFLGQDTTLELALWVKNLTDNKALTQATTQNRNGSWSAGWQPARTFGVDVTAKF
jgi:iron complex outermembrane receptor protein